MAGPTSVNSLMSLAGGVPPPSQEFKGHILICGPLKGISILIDSLRQDPLRHEQPIVVLDNNHSTDEKHHIEALYPSVCVVHGSCRIDSDMRRAGFSAADRVIVLSDHVSSSGSASEREAIRGENGVKRDMSSILASMAVTDQGTQHPLMIHEL